MAPKLSRVRGPATPRTFPAAPPRRKCGAVVFPGTEGGGGRRGISRRRSRIPDERAYARSEARGGERARARADRNALRLAAPRTCPVAHAARPRTSHVARAVAPCYREAEGSAVTRDSTSSVAAPGRDAATSTSAGRCVGATVRGRPPRPCRPSRWCPGCGQRACCRRRCRPCASRRRARCQWRQRAGRRPRPSGSCSAA